MYKHPSVEIYMYNHVFSVADAAINRYLRTGNGATETVVIVVIATKIIIQIHQSVTTNPELHREREDCRQPGRHYTEKKKVSFGKQSPLMACH